MEKTNSKVLTLSFAIAGALVGFTVSLLMRSFAGVFAIVARLSDTDVLRHGLPIAIGLAVFFALQFNSRVLSWGDEVVSEVKRVVWPQQKELTAMTTVVIVMVLISSVIVTSFDFISGYLINGLMR